MTTSMTESQKKFGVKNATNTLDHVVGFYVESEDMYFNATLFFRHLYSYRSVDVMCYTFNCGLLGNSFPIDRVIANKLIGTIPDSLKYKLWKNIHSKMYICKGRNYTHIWVGSQNFNTPTYKEIMFKVSRRNHAACKRYFDSCWHNLL